MRTPKNTMTGIVPSSGVTCLFTVVVVHIGHVVQEGHVGQLDEPTVTSHPPGGQDGGTSEVDPSRTAAELLLSSAGLVELISERASLSDGDTSKPQLLQTVGVALSVQEPLYI